MPPLEPIWVVSLTVVLVGCVGPWLCGRSAAGPGQIRSGGRGQLASRVLDLPIHDPQVLRRIGPNDLIAGDPAGLSAVVWTSRRPDTSSGGWLV